MKLQKILLILFFSSCGFAAQEFDAPSNTTQSFTSKLYTLNQSLENLDYLAGKHTAKPVVDEFLSIISTQLTEIEHEANGPSHSQFMMVKTDIEEMKNSIGAYQRDNTKVVVLAENLKKSMAHLARQLQLNN